MLALFKALPLLWRLLTVLGFIAALGGSVWGVYAYVKHQGYVEGYADASAKCEAEKRAMEEANRKAIDEAAKKLADTERELTSMEIKLDDYLMALDAAADAEPGSGDMCVSVDGVRRLNAIQ